MHGHRSAVLCVCFSSDGSLLLTGAADGTAKLWQVDTQEVLHTFSGHNGWVFSVAFNHFSYEAERRMSDSADRLMVCTGCDDHRVRVWELEDEGDSGRSAMPWRLALDFGAAHDKPNAHRSGVRSVCFSPHDTFIASCAADLSIKLWRVLDAECSSTMRSHADWVTQVGFSPDGLLVASSSYDHTAILWRVADGEALLTFYGHESWVASVAWSPDGAQLATCSGDFTVRLWDVKRADGSLSDGAMRALLRGHTSWVLSVSFSSSGKQLVSASADKSVIVWDISAVDEMDASTRDPDPPPDISKELERRRDDAHARFMYLSPQAPARACKLAQTCWRRSR